MTGGPSRGQRRWASSSGGKYRLVRLLAAGGMGVVYEAQHTVVSRRFAVKLLRRDLAEQRDILARFQREAEAAGALESEHVAAAVDFGIAEDGSPYIVMEYLAGESLRALLEREGPLPVARAADLVSQACRGMEAAHAAGIVHRDLKPQNLFVCRRDGRDRSRQGARLRRRQAADDRRDERGDAHRHDPRDRRVHVARAGARRQGRRSTRRRLRAGRDPLRALLRAKSRTRAIPTTRSFTTSATQPAVPLESVAPELPAGFSAIVVGALAADPAARPASAGALVQALAPFAKREVWPAPKLDDSGAPRLSSAPPSPIGQARGIEGGAESASRSRRGWRPSRLGPIVGLSAVVIVGALVVMGVARRRQNRRVARGGCSGHEALAGVERTPSGAGAPGAHFERGLHSARHSAGSPARGCGRGSVHSSRAATRGAASVRLGRFVRRAGSARRQASRCARHLRPTEPVRVAPSSLLQADVVELQSPGDQGPRLSGTLHDDEANAVDGGEAGLTLRSPLEIAER